MKLTKAQKRVLSTIADSQDGLLRKSTDGRGGNPWYWVSGWMQPIAVRGEPAKVLIRDGFVAMKTNMDPMLRSVAMVGSLTDAGRAALQEILAEWKEKG